jgi:rod shape-determining protein MreD
VAGFWGKLDHFARNLVPATTMLGLVVLGMVPLQLPYYGPISPSLPLVAVFFWTIRRPELLPGWAVFALGLFEDLVGGGLLGLSAFSYVLMTWVVDSQMRFFRSLSFLMQWIMFVPLCLAIGILQWLASMAISAMMLPPLPMLVGALLTATLFPFVVLPLIAAQKVLSGPG